MTVEGEEPQKGVGFEAEKGPGSICVVNKIELSLVTGAWRERRLRATDPGGRLRRVIKREWDQMLKTASGCWAGKNTSWRSSKRLVAIMPQAESDWRRVSGSLLCVPEAGPGVARGRGVVPLQPTQTPDSPWVSGLAETYSRRTENGQSKEMLTRVKTTWHDLEVSGRGQQVRGEGVC